MKRYLQISIHDNDFWISQETLGRTIYDLLDCIGAKNVTEETLPLIKTQVDRLWQATYALYKVLDEGVAADMCFDCDIEIVELKDIKVSDNYETLYVPLSGNNAPFIV